MIDVPVYREFLGGSWREDFVLYGNGLAGANGTNRKGWGGVIIEILVVRDVLSYPILCYGRMGRLGRMSPMGKIWNG